MGIIRFNVTAVVEQTIQCIGESDVHEIRKGLEEGKYATTISHEEGAETPYIIDVATGEPVAFVVSQYVPDNTPCEYFDFDTVEVEE